MAGDSKTTSSTSNCERSPRDMAHSCTMCSVFRIKRRTTCSVTALTKMTRLFSLVFRTSRRRIRAIRSRRVRSKRIFWVAAAVVFGALAAAAPHLIRHKSAHRESATTLGPAVGMPGAPPTTSSGLQERIGDMEKRLRERPDDVAAAVLLADALLRQARATTDPRPTSRASEVLNAVLTEDPVQYDALRMLGAIDLSQHRFRDALTVARRARDLRPTDAWNYGVMGDALIELGEYEEAFKTFDT